MLIDVENADRDFALDCGGRGEKGGRPIADRVKPVTEETLFAATLEKATKAERDSFLEEACAGDSGLRRRIEAILESHDDAEFLKTSAAERAAIAFGGVAPRASGAEDVEVGIDDVPGEGASRFSPRASVRLSIGQQEVHRLAQIAPQSHPSSRDGHGAANDIKNGLPQSVTDRQPGRKCNVIHTLCRSRSLAAAMRGAGALARLALGTILLLSSVAVFLGASRRGRPLGEATVAGVPMRIDSVDVGPSLGPDRFLDPESGLPVVAVLSGRGTLRCASWSPWRDERGQAQLVGLLYGVSPNRPGDYALVRLSQPDGAVLDRISHEDLPGWVAPPCWFPDRSERLLLAGGDGQLYRLDFGSDDARGPWPRPLPWRAGGDPLRIARFGDLSWPGNTQLGPRLVLASLYTRAEGRRGPEERSIWWLRLDRGAESIVAARRLVPPGEPDSSPGEDERFPVLSSGAGPPVLAWLERARGRPGDAWRLRAAPIEVDADSGDPFVMVRGARILATDCACVAPAFGADGGWIAYVAAGSDPSPTIRQLPLGVQPVVPARTSAPVTAPEG